MINKWGVSNFKSILHAELELAPLTIFAGTSNAGKSSFLQSMLLTAQNLQDKLPHESISQNSKYHESIRLNGKYIELGNFPDVYSTFAESGDDLKKITIKYGISPVKTAAQSALNIVEEPDLWDLEMVHQGGTVPEWGPLESVSGGFSVGYSVSLFSERLEIVIPGEEIIKMNLKELREEKLLQFSSLVEDIKNDALLPKLLETRLDGVFLDKGEQRNIFINAGDNFMVDDNCIDAYSLAQSKLRDFPDKIKRRDRVELKTTMFLPDGLVYNEKAYVEDIWGGDSHGNNMWSGGRFLLHVLADFGAKTVTTEPIKKIRISKGTLWKLITIFEKQIDLTEMIEKALSEQKNRDGINLSDWYRLCLELPVEKQELLKKKLASMWVNVRYYFINNDTTDLSIPYRHIDLPGELKTASDCVSRYFNFRFKYIKALREDPKIHNMVPPDANPSDIGTKGEYLEYVLSRNWNLYVKTIDPDYFDEDRDISKPYKIKRRTLLDAVNSWANYIGIAHSISVPSANEPSEDSGEYYSTNYTVKVAIVKSGGSGHYLTNVGTGVSQALPVLVACLMAGEDSTIIIEQPEYQLHAKSQSRLADFLLAMALCGRQSIIETHSEHIVNRLRLRMAEAPGDSLCDIGKIYFAELDEGITNFREIEINEFGMYSDWPEDFFDERTRASGDILYAADKKREEAGWEDGEEEDGTGWEDEEEDDD